MRRLVLVLALFLVPILGLAQAPPVQQTISLTTATIDSAVVSTPGIHQISAQFKAGTVAGSYSTCTAQAKTSFNGTTFLTVGTARSITITTGAVSAWTVTEPLGVTVSSTAANGFGVQTKFTVACVSYGTTAPSVLSLVFSTNSSAANVTATVDSVTIDGGTVEVTTTGLALETKQDTGNNSLASIDTKLTSQATATKQDTGNTSLGSIDTKLSSQATATKQDTGNTSLGSIDTKLSSQATATKQDTGNTSLGSIDTKLSSQATATKQDTGNTSLASIKTNTDPLATAGGGGYVRQDSTATIAKESGGNLATVASVVKAIDTATGSTDPGILNLCTRTDSLSTVTPADGDNVQCRTTSKGATWIQSATIDEAVDAVSVNNPVYVGAIYESAPASVASGDRTALHTTADQRLIVTPYADPANSVVGVTAAITDTTSTEVVAAGGGSLRNYITHCTISNSHATVGTFVKILDGSTILDEVYAAPLGGGASFTYPFPLRGTAATAINAQPVTTGANVIVACNGYKGL